MSHPHGCISDATTSVTRTPTQPNLTGATTTLHEWDGGWVTKNDSDERNGDEQNDDAKHDEEESGDARTEG